MALMSTAGGNEALRELFSLRDRNLLFLASILEALQIDTWKPDIDYASIKKAFTPTAVRKIHEAVVQIWPSLDDYERCHAEDRQSISGLYIGTYEPKPKIPQPRRGGIIGCSGAVSAPSPVTDRRYRISLLPPCLRLRRDRTELWPFLIFQLQRCQPYGL
jgi:hypothetical protein